MLVSSHDRVELVESVDVQDRETFLVVKSYPVGTPGRLIVRFIPDEIRFDSGNVDYFTKRMIKTHHREDEIYIGREDEHKYRAVE